MFELPSEIAALKELIALDLTNNSISTLPTIIGNFILLQKLKLANVTQIAFAAAHFAIGLCGRDTRRDRGGQQAQNDQFTHSISPISSGG